MRYGTASETSTIGALMAAGRITPVSTDNDPELRRLIDVVPFGLPSEAPVKTRPVLRGVIPGVEADDLIVLWTGGNMGLDGPSNAHSGHARGLLSASRECDSSFSPVGIPAISRR
ncbi:MAG: hypothetical protein KatS3mg057_2668 [Herpetosiphonaceae bacterium]|nr:MAG: hypothetical protein KatS3mg057_2668 [Herpetosiphonaceae bacterium]